VNQGRILGPVDSAFLYVDSPETPMNIGAVTIFEGQIDFAAFTKLVDGRIHQAKPYLQRIVQAPFNLGMPTWRYDPDFFIGNHVFRQQLNAPGTDEQLRQLAGHLVSGMLDRSKPLWEIHLIEGLSNNRTAIFFKIHHCMVDGLSAVEIFTLLFDLTPEIAETPHKVVHDVPYLPNALELLRDSLIQDIPHKLGVLGKLGHDLQHMQSVFMDRDKRRKALIGLSYLINDNLMPIKRYSINGRNTGKITLAWSDFSLAEVRAIRTVAEASVNDVMLTVLTGAISRYLRDQGDVVARNIVRILVPVNMRLESEKSDFGNRISVLPIDAPLDIDDPLKRLQVITDYSQAMKQSSLANSLDMILTMPSLMPSLAQPIIWGIAPLAFSFLAHLWCTNVAGPQIPVYVLGHRMLNSFGFFPLNPSMGLACVISSYNQRISMNLIADAGIIPDIVEIRQYLEQSYVALRSAAKVEPMAPIPLEPTRISPPASPSASSRTPPAQKVDVPPVSLAESSEKPVESKAETPTLAENANGVKPTASESRGADESNVVKTKDMTDDLPVSADTGISATVAAQPGGRVVATTPSMNGASGVPEPIVISEEKPVIHTNSTAESMRVAPAESAPPNQRAKLALFSEEWAQAYREAINRSASYRAASKGWQAGSLAFVMSASPRQGQVMPKAVFLDLHRGECRAARSLTSQEAYREATFVIEGDYSSWMEALNGRMPPLVMLMRGKLRLKKGSITRLLPYAQSAQELVSTAQTIE
jgi:WS/DGAT/MGAT family acyltransferase